MSQDTPHGILNVCKPINLSSHDVVDHIRVLTGVRRVGHAGTLDPLATGVLVVCIGRTATRIVEYLVDEPKTYRTRFQLGFVTDTFDAEGKIVSQTPADLNRETVERALEHFRGTIAQVPPMYSAVKHQGKPLYKLARRGIEVERQPRSVEIYRLQLIDWHNGSAHPWGSLEMDCSPGTYVRVLVHDLGQHLGCGAYIKSLTRLASGPFRLQDAITLREATEAVEADRLAELLYPVDQALAARFPALHLEEEEARRICSGQALKDSERPPGGAEMARIYGPRGNFLALAALDRGSNVWRPRKVFVSPYPDALPVGTD